MLYTTSSAKQSVFRADAGHAARKYTCSGSSRLVLGQVYHMHHYVALLNLFDYRRVAR